MRTIGTPCTAVEVTAPFVGACIASEILLDRQKLLSPNTNPVMARIRRKSLFVGDLIYNLSRELDGRYPSQLVFRGRVCTYHRHNSETVKSQPGRNVNVSITSTDKAALSYVQLLPPTKGKDDSSYQELLNTKLGYFADSWTTFGGETKGSVYPFRGALARSGPLMLLSPVTLAPNCCTRVLSRIISSTSDILSKS